MSPRSVFRPGSGTWRPGQTCVCAVPTFSGPWVTAGVGGGMSGRGGAEGADIVPSSSDQEFGKVTKISSSWRVGSGPLRTDPGAFSTLEETDLIPSRSPGWN